MSQSLTDNLDQHALLPAAVEFPVEYLLPRTEVEPPFSYRHDDFPAFSVDLHVQKLGGILRGLDLPGGAPKRYGLRGDDRSPPVPEPGR